MAAYHDNFFCTQPESFCTFEYKEPDKVRHAQYSEQKRRQLEEELQEELLEQEEDFTAYYYGTATYQNDYSNCTAQSRQSSERKAEKADYWLVQHEQEREAPAYPEGDNYTSAYGANTVPSQLPRNGSRDSYEGALPLQLPFNQAGESNPVHDLVDQELDKLELLNLAQDSSNYISEFPLPSESLLAELLSVFTGGYDSPEELVSTHHEKK